MPLELSWKSVFIIEPDKVCFIAKYSGHKCSIFFSKVLVILYLQVVTLAAGGNGSYTNISLPLAFFKTKLKSEVCTPNYCQY